MPPASFTFRYLVLSLSVAVSTDRRHAGSEAAHHCSFERGCKMIGCRKNRVRYVEGEHSVNIGSII